MTAVFGSNGDTRAFACGCVQQHRSCICKPLICCQSASMMATISWSVAFTLTQSGNLAHLQAFCIRPVTTLKRLALQLTCLQALRGGGRWGRQPALRWSDGAGCPPLSSSGRSSTSKPSAATEAADGELALPCGCP